MRVEKSIKRRGIKRFLEDLNQQSPADGGINPA